MHKYFIAFLIILAALFISGCSPTTNEVVPPKIGFKTTLSATIVEVQITNLETTPAGVVITARQQASGIVIQCYYWPTRSTIAETTLNGMELTGAAEWSPDQKIWMPLGQGATVDIVGGASIYLHLPIKTPPSP